MLKSLLVLGLVATGTLFAGDAKKYGVEDWRVGASIAVSSPTGDLKTLDNEKVGMSLGLNTTVTVKGLVFRPRMDYTFYPQNAHTYSNVYWATTKITGFSGGVDYIHNFSGGTEGAYATVGVGMTRWNWEIGAHFAPGSAWKSYTQNTWVYKPNYAIGFGYNFKKHFGFEARYNLSSLDKNTTANAFQLAATFRY